MAEPNLISALFPASTDIFPKQNNSYKYGGLTLAADITIDAVSIGIVLPTGKTISDIEYPCWMSIDEEIIWVETVADVGGVITLQSCQRGRGDSIATDHITGAYVRQPFISGHYKLLSNAITAIENSVAEGYASVVEVAIDSDPFVYSYSGRLSSIYNIALSITNSGSADILNRGYTISHYSGRTPSYYEGFTFETNPGSISASLENFVAGNNYFDIRVTGANAGSMSISFKGEGASK